MLHVLINIKTARLLCSNLDTIFIYELKRNRSSSERNHKRRLLLDSILVSREKEKIRFGCQLLNGKTHFRCLVSTTFMSKWILKAEGRALRWYFYKHNTILTFITACTKQTQWRNTSWRALEIESMLYFGHFSTFYEVYINNK